jgi:SAM-dependent methyltransferase
MHRLFETYGHRYDLHTPPNHYQHDHQLVIDLARERGLPCRLLDIGCGTGVLVEKARAAHIEAFGLDASETMIAAARNRVPENAVRVQRMQYLDEQSRYDLVVSLSWSIHYCADAADLSDILSRIRTALVPGGGLLLQVAHGPNLGEGWREDRELGPTGIEDDISFRYRFRPDSSTSRVYADYAYGCRSLDETLEETHILEMADASAVAHLIEAAGFYTVEIWNSWRRDEFSQSGIVFVWGRSR